MGCIDLAHPARSRAHSSTARTAIDIDAFNGLNDGIDESVVTLDRALESPVEESSKDDYGLKSPQMREDFPVRYPDHRKFCATRDRRNASSIVCSEFGGLDRQIVTKMLSLKTTQCLRRPPFGQDENNIVPDH